MTAVDNLETRPTPSQEQVQATAPAASRLNLCPFCPSKHPSPSPPHLHLPQLLLRHQPAERGELLVTGFLEWLVLLSGRQAASVVE